MSRIYWDTMLFAYLLENHDQFGEPAARIRERMLERGDSVVTSIFTLGELLVAPIRYERTELEYIVRDLLRPPHVEMIGMDEATMDRFARIRSRMRGYLRRTPFTSLVRLRPASTCS